LAAESLIEEGRMTVFAKVGILWVAGLADLWCTVTLQKVGALHELNPLAAIVADTPFGFLGLKLASLGIVTEVLVVLRLRANAKTSNRVAWLCTAIECVVALLGCYLVHVCWSGQ
jgi:hypothetical protein